MKVSRILRICLKQTALIVPGICTTEGCDYTVGVEPDCVEGWCEACDTPSVQSCLILAGVI